MNLNELKLRSFRNYREIAAQFDPGVNLIVGDNAQGKTNLLEAISYLGSGKSFRAQKTSEMVRFQEDFGEIDGSVFSQERQQSIRWILFPGSRPRQLWLNGAKKKTAGEIAGVLPTVLFCPEDLMILKMGASQRRRFGDLALCALRPNYDAALTEYNRILEQKSRILKDHFENPGILEILPEYNTRLCQVGALLISYRARFYDSLGKAAANYHNQFSGGAENFTLTRSHEHIFMLTKSRRYFYDWLAIAEPIAPTTALRKKAGRGVGKYSAPVPGQPQTQNINKPREKGSITDDMISPVRAKRDVWFINTVPYKGGHFAAYPPLLAETCILAGCPKGGIVLDPFMGSGTTGLAAKRHGRHYIGIELNTEFCSLARERIGGDTH